MPPAIPSAPPNLTRVWSSATSAHTLPPPSDVAELLATGNAAPSVAGRLIALTAFSENAPEYAAVQPAPPADMPAWSDVIASAVFPSRTPLSSSSPFYRPAASLSSLRMPDSLLRCDPTAATPMEVVLVGRRSARVDNPSASLSFLPFTSTDDYKLTDGETSQLEYKKTLGIKTATPVKSVTRPPVTTTPPLARRRSRTSMPHPDQIITLKPSKKPNLDSWKQQVREMQESARKKIPVADLGQEVLADTGFARMTKMEQIRAKKREQSRIAREKQAAQDVRRHEKMKKLAKRKKKMAKLKRGEPYVSSEEEDDDEEEPEVQEVVPTQPQTQSQPQTMNVDSQNTNGDSHPNNSNMRDGNPSQNRRSPRIQQQRSDNNFDPRADQNASQGGGPPRYAGDDYPHQRQPPYSGDHPRTPRRDFPRTPPPYHNAPPQYPPHDGSQNRPYPHDQGYPPQAYRRYDDRPRGPADHWGPRSNPPHYDSRGRYPSPKNYSPGPPRNGAYPPQSYPPQQYPPPPHGFDPRFPPDHGPYSPHPSQGGPAPPFYGAPEPPPERLPRNVFEQKRKELYEAIHHTIRDLRPEDSRTIDDFLDNQRYMFGRDEQEKDFLLERRGHELTLLRIQKFNGMWKVVKLKSGR